MLYGSSSSSVVQTAMSLAYYSAVLNIGLGIFNLIPVPPLDGSHVLGELSPKAAELYGRYARYWGLALILLLASGALSRPLGFLNDADFKRYVEHHPHDSSAASSTYDLRQNRQPGIFVIRLPVFYLFFS